MTTETQLPPPSALRIGDRHPVAALALVYAAVFSVFGVYTPYFPVWLKAHGLDETQIAMAVSAPMVLRLAVTPLIGRVADGHPDRRWLMAGLILCCFFCACVLSGLHGYGPILPVACLMLVAYQPVQPLLDATVGVLARRGRVRDIGRLRLCGSVSFAVVAVFSGFLLGATSIEHVFMVYIVLLGLAAGTAFLLPAVGPLEVRAQVRPFNLLKRPPLLVVFLIIALISSSQAFYLSFGTMHMLAIGYPDWSIGLLWTVSVVAEIVVFWYAPSALVRIGAYRLLMIAAITTLLRWFGMAFDPPMIVVSLLQTLHAGTLSCTFLALMAFIQRFVEDEASARAQSATMTLTGLFMAVATLAMGPIYQRLGGQGYMIAAVLPALGAMLLFAFRKKLAG